MCLPSLLPNHSAGSSHPAPGQVTRDKRVAGTSGLHFPQPCQDHCHLLTSFLHTTSFHQPTQLRPQVPHQLGSCLAHATTMSPNSVPTHDSNWGTFLGAHPWPWLALQWYLKGVIAWGKTPRQGNQEGQKGFPDTTIATTLARAVPWVSKAASPVLLQPTASPVFSFP